MILMVITTQTISMKSTLRLPDYGSADAAFAACDADGQSTTEFNGVEVRSYGCSQQTRNDYGVWGFAIYYMDVNGNIIN